MEYDNVKNMKSNFNYRQVNYLFVQAVESKFKDNKPDYVKQLDIPNSQIQNQLSLGSVDEKPLKGFKKSEFVIENLKKWYKQSEIEKRQGMKLEEHTQKLASFTNEVDQKFNIQYDKEALKYQVSIR